MRIATLQFTPIFSDVPASIAHADTLISNSIDKLHDLDLLVLPELAFTGYNFPILSAVESLLEPTAAGPSTSWASRTAKSLQCTVAVGYPEHSADGKNYNALVFVNACGEVVAHNRKTFLYYSDEVWASEGQGFYVGELPLGSQANSSGGFRTIKAAAGICMDINPYKFEAPWTLYEFANHALSSKVKLVVLSMAWLTHLPSWELALVAKAPDRATLSYWVARFEPLLAPSGADEEVVVVCANRTGEEGTAARIGDVKYAGTSCVMGMKKCGECMLWDVMGRADEGVLVADTDEEPKYRIGKKIDDTQNGVEASEDDDKGEETADNA